MGNNSSVLMLGLITALVATGLLFGSFVLPWWGVSFRTEYDYDEDTHVSEDGIGVDLRTGSIFGGSVSLYSSDGSLSTLFQATSFMLFGAIICGVLSLLALILMITGKLRGMKLAVILISLALFLSLLAPIVFWVAFPMSWESDRRLDYERNDREYEEPEDDDPSKSFFGEVEEKEEYSYDKVSWGGDIGWFLTFVSSFLFLLCGILAIVGGRKRSNDAPLEIRPMRDPAPPSAEGYDNEYDRPRRSY